MTLSGTTTPDKSGPGSNKKVLRIPQSSTITGASLSVCLMSYLWYPLDWGYYVSAEMQSVYSTARSEWASVFNI